MTQEEKSITVTPATDNVPEEEPAPKQEYDLHIIVPEEMRDKLKDAAVLAFRMEKISKPALIDLMNLFIVWGMTVLKQQWQDRKGYK